MSARHIRAGSAPWWGHQVSLATFECVMCVLEMEVVGLAALCGLPYESRTINLAGLREVTAPLLQGKCSTDCTPSYTTTFMGRDSTSCCITTKVCQQEEQFLPRVLFAIALVQRRSTYACRSTNHQRLGGHICAGQEPSERDFQVVETTVINMERHLSVEQLASHFGAAYKFVVGAAARVCRTCCNNSAYTSLQDCTALGGV